MLAKERFEEAQTLLNNLVDSNVETESWLEAKLLLAEIAFNNNQLEKSEEIIEKVLVHTPNNETAKLFKEKYILPVSNFQRPKPC